MVLQLCKTLESTWDVIESLSILGRGVTLVTRISEPLAETREPK